jgi:succinoglycan biosynthesis protein ExoM
MREHKGRPVLVIDHLKEKRMKISICICTYRRPELLERLLNILKDIYLVELEQHDIRILIVDNCPNGEVAAVCERVAGAMPLGIDLVEENQRGLSFARSRAVEEALNRRADFIAFLDDDDLPQPDWLFHLIKKQAETQADIVAGVFPPEIIPEWPEWLKKSPLFDEPKHKLKTKYGAPGDMGIGSTLISRRIIDKLKAKGPLFSTESGKLGCEDADFFVRAGELEAIFSKADKAIVRRSYHEQRLTLVGLLRDAYRIGNTIRQLVEKYGTPAQIRRRKQKAFQRLFVALPAAVLELFSTTRLVRRLYQISKEAGVLLGYGGKK